jgi:hypothetical protein
MPSSVRWVVISTTTVSGGTLAAVGLASQVSVREYISTQAPFFM